MAHLLVLFSWSVFVYCARPFGLYFVHSVIMCQISFFFLLKNIYHIYIISIEIAKSINCKSPVCN